MYSISIDFSFGNAFQWRDVLIYVVMLALNSLDRWARQWLSHRVILSLESEILLMLHILIALLFYVSFLLRAIVLMKGHLET